MKKWISFFLGLFLIISLAGCGKENNPPELPPKAGMEKITTVGGATFDLPKGMFVAEAIETDSEDNMKVDLQMFEVPKDDATFLLIMKLDPPFYLAPIFWVADWESDSIKNGFTEAYQKNFTNAYLREVGQGKQGVSWGKSEVLEYNGNKVLKQQGTVTTLRTRQKSIHEHYSWIHSGEVYVAIAFYDQNHQPKMKFVVDQILNTIHFK